MNESLNGAEIDGPYRYRLWRDTSRGKVSNTESVLWIMLNPSTADATADDPTIRKVVGFSHRLNFGQARIVNVCAFRSTDPKVLSSPPISDVVGPKNFEVIYEELKTASHVVLAWGANIHRKMKNQDVYKASQVVEELAFRSTAPVSILGWCANGAPKHPLMLGYDTLWSDWRAFVASKNHYGVL